MISFYAHPEESEAMGFFFPFLSKVQCIINNGFGLWKLSRKVEWNQQGPACAHPNFDHINAKREPEKACLRVKVEILLKI